MALEPTQTASRRRAAPDAVIVGSGPNGLAAALTLARAGLRVRIYEGAEQPGGGCRTAELTLPGYSHDVCSAVHPLLAASPFFARAQPALRLLTPATAFAHPLEGERAAAVAGSPAETAASLGADGPSYRRLLEPLVEHSQQLMASTLAPLLRLPRHPLTLARFGLLGLCPVTVLARAFRTAEARALLAGLGAHSMQPLQAPGTGAFALLLGTLAHSVGWPVVQGGSSQIAQALLAQITAAGGELRSGQWIGSLRELPECEITMLDVTPRQLLALADGRLPDRYSRALRRYRYGPGSFKVDWALSGPVPWRAPACRETATIHLGGTLEEIAHSEHEVACGRHPERPFAIVVQPSVLDAGRAPAGHHTLYAYCHVPAGSQFDMAGRIEAQIERFAPGFRDLVLARSTMNAAQLQRYDPNYVAGDINGGSATLAQTLFRPMPSARPYATPLPGVYLCSSSTPPGGGVHGMCGEGAALAALRGRS